MLFLLTFRCGGWPRFLTLQVCSVHGSNGALHRSLTTTQKHGHATSGLRDMLLLPKSTPGTNKRLGILWVKDLWGSASTHFHNGREHGYVKHEQGSISKWHVTNRHGKGHTLIAWGKIPKGSLPCGWKSQLWALISSVSFHWCHSCCSEVCQRESSSALANFLSCWEGRCYLHQSPVRGIGTSTAQSHTGTKLFPTPLEKKIHSVLWQSTQQHC